MHPAIAQVEAYWHGLLKGRPVPLRSDIDPRGINQALEYTFILEKIAPGLARFRLAGTHLNDLMGMEVRGMPLTSFFTPEARRVMSDHLTELFEAPMAFRMGLFSDGGFGRAAMEGELLLLPLRSDLGDVSRALGCLVTTSAIGRAPRRFEIREVRATPLMVHGDPLESRLAPEPETPEAGDGMAEDAAVFKPAPTRPADGRPVLRLVKSDTPET